MSTPTRPDTRPVTTSTSVARWEPRRQPRRELVSESDLAMAADYRRRTELFTGWREVLVGRLGLRRGDTVIDVGCGTGLNLAALRAAVGPHGRVIALDESPRLLTVAARHVARSRWDNVELINAPAETAALSVHADAALFAAAPDVLGRRAALQNLCGQLRAGAAVAAGGWKKPGPWMRPLLATVTALTGPLVAESTGFERPWRLLGEQVPNLHVTRFWTGIGYLAHGHTPTGTDSTPTTTR